MTTAKYRNPCQVGRYVISAIHSAFGSATLNWRCTKSSLTPGVDAGMGSADRSGPCPETQRPDSAALSTVGAEQSHLESPRPRPARLEQRERAAACGAASGHLTRVGN